MKLNNIVYSFSEFASAMAKLHDEKHFDYLVNIIGEDFGEEGLGCIYILENTQTHEKSPFSKEIQIADHCFIGNGVSILKGASIPADSVIATKSVVTKLLTETMSLYAGVPAKLVKKSIRYIK